MNGFGNREKLPTHAQTHVRPRQHKRNTNEPKQSQENYYMTGVRFSFYGFSKIFFLSMRFVFLHC
jgi:hypothetical protein